MTTGLPPNPHDTDTKVRRPTAAVLATFWLFLLAGIFLVPRLTAIDNPGDFLIRNTVRLALLYWAVAVVTMIRNACGARVAWTVACAAYLIHVATAFEYAHHWAHTAAFRHVEEVSGYGEGIFVSYLFTLAWTADAIWWWADRRTYENRPRWLGWAVHGFMVFVIANATVVFESGATRWIGAAALAVLAACWLGRCRTHLAG